MAREHWMDSDDPRRVQRGLAGSLTLWIIGAVVLFGLIGIAIWGFGVGTSDIKGQGDAFKTKNSGTNRIAAQERFEDMYQDILVADQRIDVMSAAAVADPSTVNKTNLTGSMNYCIQAVGQYNAEARKYTAQDFRSIDLPAVIDHLDPATDCKPTKEN